MLTLLAEKLGAAFMIVRSDIGGNINRLDVEDEMAQGSTKQSDSATNGLLWLKRSRTDGLAPRFDCCSPVYRPLTPG